MRGLLGGIPCAGAAAWLMLAGMAASGASPLGPIETLFALGPLAIVPLGLELAADGLDRRLRVAVRLLVAPAAACAIASLFARTGLPAASLAFPWVAFALLVAAAAFLPVLARARMPALDVVCRVVACAGLVVGAGWLLLARGGIPTGFPEPIPLLTAVHFHFTGFAAALLAGRALALGGRLLRVAAVAILTTPLLLAVGIVAVPVLEIAAAFALAAAVTFLGLALLWRMGELPTGLPRLLLVVSGASVLLPMALAAIWATGEYTGEPRLGLLAMARMHGTANAVGFSFCGLAGWVLAARRARAAGAAGEREGVRRPVLTAIRPGPARMESFRAAGGSAPFSYADVGATRDGRAPRGFAPLSRTVTLGRGEDAFARAREALLSWRHLDLGWVESFPRDAAIEPGSTVVVATHHGPLHFLNLCRVVWVQDEPRRFGFAYGTLAAHLEQGEERFVVAWNEDDSVMYEVASFSRPGTLPVRIGFPIARLLQRAFLRDSTGTMRRVLGMPD